MYISYSEARELELRELIEKQKELKRLDDKRNKLIREIERLKNSTKEYVNKLFD